MKKQPLYILAAVCICSAAMNVVDLYLLPPYFLKSLIKAILFAGVPLIYFGWQKADRALLKLMFSLPKKPLLLSVAFGLGFYAAILGGYFLTRNIIDYSGITGKLIGTAGVNPGNFVFVALYISFCNSLLEEFFFRGFAFLTLKRYLSRKTAYAFSAFLFAFYHIGMTFGWVEPLIFLLALVGLTVGGLVFDWIAEKTDSICPSWLVHMFINFGINTVGFLLFGMI